METDDTLARLTFNAVATRTFFTDRSNGVRLRIEAGVVAFRPVAARRGIDILTIERRTRGVVAEVPRDTLTRRLMTRLFKAGLSDDQPYFTLQPSSPRGWFSLDHHPADQPPQRQPLMVVSEFEPPPVAIDMGLWRRVERTLAGPKPISPALWQEFMAMFHSAVRMTERSTRGRKSSERIQAEKLLVTIERNVTEFQALAVNQPELVEDVASLLFSVTGELTVGDTDISVIEFPSGRTKRGRPPEIDRKYVQQVLADTADTDIEAEAKPATPPAKPKRRPRRRWPDATEDEIRSEARLLEIEPEPEPASEPEPDPVADPEPEAPEAEYDILAGEETDDDVDPEIADPLDIPVRTTPPLAAKAFEPEADPEPEAESEAESDPEPEAESEAEPDPEPEAELETEPKPEPESEPEAELEADESKPVDFDPQPEVVDPVGYLEAEQEPEPETPEPEQVQEPETPEPEQPTSTEESHEGEADFDLADVMPPSRPQPDRDDDEVVDDEEGKDKDKDKDKDR